MLVLVATAPTVYGIETATQFTNAVCSFGCNSAYRLWYAPKMSALLLPERSEGKIVL